MFNLTKILNGRTNVPEPEFYVAGGTVTDGMALVLAGGKVTACGATVKPTHIAMANKASGEKVPCYAVSAEMMFEVACTAVPAAEGDKVTLADGVKVTATTQSGVATVVSKNGATKAGDKVIVKFA